MFQPIARVVGIILRWIYDLLVNNFSEPENISLYAISIIIMTVLVSLITIPMTKNQQKQAEKSGEIKPKIDEIKKKYSYDPQIMQKKMQELYKEEGVGVGFSSCLVIIFQLFILIALNYVIRNPEKYVFTEGISHIKDNFFWVPTLQKADPLFYGLPLLTSLSQFVVQLFTMKTNPQMQSQNQAPGMASMNNMFLLMPIMYYFMFRNLAAGLPLYWTTSSIARLVILACQYLIGLSKKDKEEKDEKVVSKDR